MNNQVVLINTSLRTFNGVKPQKRISLDESRVEYYLSNGFERVNVLIDQKQAEEQAELDALNADAEATAKANKKANKQKKSQEQLDAEYEAKKTGDELPALPPTEDEDEAEDLDGEDLGGEEKKDDGASDLDALNAELEAK